jgi:hypothetical protein
MHASDSSIVSSQRRTLLPVIRHRANVRKGHVIGRLPAIVSRTEPGRTRRSVVRPPRNSRLRRILRRSAPSPNASVLSLSQYLARSCWPIAVIREIESRGTRDPRIRFSQHGWTRVIKFRVLPGFPWFKTSHVNRAHSFCPAARRSYARSPSCALPIPRELEL